MSKTGRGKLRDALYESELTLINGIALFVGVVMVAFSVIAVVMTVRTVVLDIRAGAPVFNDALEGLGIFLFCSFVGFTGGAVLGYALPKRFVRWLIVRWYKLKHYDFPIPGAYLNEQEIEEERVKADKFLQEFDERVAKQLAERKRRYEEEFWRDPAPDDTAAEKAPGEEPETKPEPKPKPEPEKKAVVVRPVRQAPGRRVRKTGKKDR